MKIYKNTSISGRSLVYVESYASIDRPKITNLSFFSRQISIFFIYQTKLSKNVLALLGFFFITNSYYGNLLQLISVLPHHWHQVMLALILVRTVQSSDQLIVACVQVIRGNNHYNTQIYVRQSQTANMQIFTGLY